MKVLCETSVRHIHLDEDGLTALFGKGAKLTPDRPLSQPKQFLCKERVTLVGPKNSYENVGIIGPARDVMQAEISRTDSFYLGIKNVPMRLSRDVDGAPVITVKNGDKKIDIPVIVAMRH
ncbi:MAG: propanediol utilization protein, partial [Christensenellaceae bacterium]|nr:propanediol utilization protein [Christensenellaceae bacterium]